MNVQHKMITVTINCVKYLLRQRGIDSVNLYSSKGNFQIRFHAALNVSQSIAEMSLYLFCLF